MYSWQNDKYEEIKPEECKGLELNLYDLNKNIVSQLTPMTDEEIKKKVNMIQIYHSEIKNIHYMLLCKDFNYYTIFEKSYEGLNEPFGNTIKEIISDLGDIYSIELTKDKMAIEIWIKPSDMPAEIAEPMVFYLFGYDAGVVYYG